MKRADIEHLATLARLRLSEDEISHFETELSSIMEYVGAVSDIAGETANTTPKTGAVFNVFRQDEVTNQPEEFTKVIMAEMPHTDGRFLAVKKILNPDN